MRFHLARMLAREAGHARRAATSRNSTRCASRPDGSAPPGASSVPSFRPGRTRRYRNGPARDRRAARGRPRPRRAASRRPTTTGRTCRSPNSVRSSRCSTDWRTHRDDARVLLVRELDSDGYRRWVDDYRDFVRTEGAAVLPVAADPAAPRPRHGARRASGPPTSRSAATSRSCAGPTSRRSTSCASPASGCATRSSSCARRSATTRRRSSRGSRRSRTTSG